MNSEYSNFYSSYITGYFGSLTQAAVEEWQAAHGIVSSGSPSTTGYGSVGPRTRAAIAAACASIQTPVTPSTPVAVPIPAGGGGGGGSSGGGGGGGGNPPPPSTGGPSLSVSGNQILANGQPFQIKGLNVDVLAPDPVAVADDFQQDGWTAPYIAAAYQNIDVDSGGMAALLAGAKAWDANTVRIWLVEPNLDPQNDILTPAQRSAYVAEVQSTVNELNADGFVVIASMTGAEPIDPTASTTRAWQTILPVLAGNSSVMLDMFNEPQDENNWQVWEYGGTVTDPNGQSIPVVGMQTLLNSIRSAGAHNVIIAQTYNYRDVSTSNLLSDPLGQLVYAIHPRIFSFDNTVSSTYPGLAVGNAFSTSTDATVFDQAFGNAAQQVPVIADEWDMLEFTGPAVSCQNIPQLGYFEAAYLQKYTDGVVGYSMDYPDYTITTDWNYDPRGYANVSQCSSSTNSILTNIGDVGALLYAWYHGTDLWDGTGSPTPAAPTITSITPSSGPVGTQLTITGTEFTASGNELLCESGCSYSPGVIPNATDLSSNGTTLAYIVPADTVPGAYGLAVATSNGTSNTEMFTVTVTGGTGIACPGGCAPTTGALSATPTSGTAPLSMTFATHGLTTGNSYSLNFGDGTPVHALTGVSLGTPIISHTYTSAGTYTATLTDSSGNILGTETITVTS